MAVINDMIPEFDLFQPADVDGALELLGKHDDAWILAGGLDTFDWFKDRAKRPDVVIDLGAIDELRGIRERDGGYEIGALTPLSDIENDAAIKAKFPMLAEAARAVATPQVRNQGTLGGNVVQDTRCWYYRGGWPCYRAGGNICYADTPTSMNREHCIFGASRCVAVSPSDSAPALVALDAVMVVRSRSGEREVPAADFFIGPSTDITRMTILNGRELLVAVRIPSTFAGAHQYFEKVRDRNAWDFPLVNVAAAFKRNGSTIEDARVAVGAVAPYPMRLENVEAQLRGKSADEATGRSAGELAIANAKPLRHNGYKLPLMRNLIMRAVRDAQA